MSHEDAIAALQEAVVADETPAPAAPEQAVEAPSASTPAPVEGAPEESVTEPEVQAPEAGNTEEEFVPFNPDDLPPDLIPAWKQLQSSFTPRLQEAAAIKKQVEELGGLDTLQQAANLYQQIGDPQNWPALYEELYQAMEQAGFEFEDGHEAPIAPLAPGQLPDDDPDLAPLVRELETLRGRSDEQQQLIENFVQAQEYQRTVAEEELRQAQLLAHMQQQVVGIRQANPSYTDDDMRAIIELAPFFNDDFGLAQQRYEEMFATRLNRWLDAKKAAGASVSTQPVAGAGIVSTEDSEPQTLREAEEEAVELMRRLQAAGELDFT